MSRLNRRLWLAAWPLAAEQGTPPPGTRARSHTRSWMAKPSREPRQQRRPPAHRGAVRAQRAPGRWQEGGPPWTRARAEQPQKIA